LQVDEAVWHHGWVLPNRERITRYFCDAFQPTNAGSADSADSADGLRTGAATGAASCANVTELDVSAESTAYEEWTDGQLQVLAAFAPTFGLHDE
jgi:hypothetical protein